MNRLVEVLGNLEEQRKKVVQIANSLKRKAVEFSRSVRSGEDVNAPSRADELRCSVEKLMYESIVLSAIDNRARILEKELGKCEVCLDSLK